ncbi:HdeD family acid-resistance protein [Planosporangium sp. 12N6]|uniref:HdeD family acid-resistance protein n=1 Tax=Planosporangium spinosum TaxID=3402278 RepID=UPI003CEC61EA
MNAATVNRNHTGLLALRGVIALVFGIWVVLFPGITVLALDLLFAGFALFIGVVTIISAFSHHEDAAQRTAHVVEGLLAIGAGLVALLWPGITLLLLVLLLGAWALVSGAVAIGAATRAHGQWLPLLVGVLSMIAGVLILARPAVGVVAVALTIGWFAIAAGVLMLIEAWRLYRLQTGARGRMAPAGA